VKPGADQRTLKPKAKPHFEVGVREAFKQLAEGNHGHELAWGNADEARDDHHEAVHDQGVEQVIAVVGPYRHLALAVVQGVQAPPPLQLMLQAVQPVADEIELKSVSHKGPVVKKRASRNRPRRWMRV
jgi:hypothetical protein